MLYLYLGNDTRCGHGYCRTLTEHWEQELRFIPRDDQNTSYYYTNNMQHENEIIFHMKLQLQDR